MKIKIQAGVESYIRDRRVVRLTPVSKVIDVTDEVGNLLLIILGYADSQDMQPGDGEVDLPVKIVDSLERVLPGVKSLNLPGDENAFVRIVRVA